MKKIIELLNPNYTKYLTNSENNVIIIPLKEECSKNIAEFYKSDPFPNFDEYETISDLDKKLEKNDFFKSLKDNIGFNKNILEVGCGTGQQSIMLAHNTNNNIIALDATLESLKLGSIFAKNNNINNIEFIRGDIFDDIFLEETFDIILCSGVLHHTKDMPKALKIISQLLKPNGILILGLYNKYGRLKTKLIQIIIKIFNYKYDNQIINIFDNYVKKNISKRKKNSWIKDQYYHPYETTHTFDEILELYRLNNIEPLSSIPSFDLKSLDYSDIFRQQPRGNFFTRLFAQISMIFTKHGNNGGLFIVLGKKN